MGVLRDVFQLYFRYDRLASDQQERNQGEGLLEILLRALLRGADVRIPADHEDHAPAGGRDQCAFEKSGPDRTGRESSILYGPNVGESDSYRDQRVGRSTVHTHEADGCTAEDNGMSV